MKIKRFLSLIIAAVIAALAIPAGLAANSSVIEIGTLKEFVSFAKNCRTDTWSQGKTVRLTHDIDLTGEEFSPIPTFGGHLDGGGYTVKGLKVTNDGSYMGLFRYIQKGALVENLNVSGTVAPGGTGKTVGGIVGELSGTVKNCAFDGAVKAEASVGGIAGSVTETGLIEGCRFKGSVTAKNYTGGIVGELSGTVKNSENNGSVNTAEDRGSSSSTTALGIDIDIDDIRDFENYDLCTDTGGIAGYSKGQIIGSSNYGKVGFESVGYNTGGICGRQSGYISDCKNYGEVLGRKDVGGIVGQAEPYVLIEFSEDSLNKIKTELDVIQAIVDDNLDNLDDDITNKLDDINDAITRTRDDLDKFSDSATDYADEISDRFNELSDRVQRAVEDSEAVFDDLSDGVDLMGDGLDYLADCCDSIATISNLFDEAVDEVATASDELSAGLDSISGGTDRLADSVDELRDAADSMEDAVDALQDGVTDLSSALKKKENIEKSFENLWKYSDDFAEAAADAGDSIDDIKSAIDELLDNSKIAKALKKAFRNLDDLAACYRDIGTAFGDITDALLMLGEDFDTYSVRQSLKFMERGLKSLSNGCDHLKKAIDLMEPVGDTLRSVSDELENTADIAQNAVDSMSDGADMLKSASDRIRKIAEDFTEDGEIHMPSASEYLNDSIDAVNDAVKAVQDEFSLLNDIVKDKKDGMVDDLQRISDRFDAIANVTEDAYDKYLNYDKDDIYEDVSDSQTGGIWGRIESSVNSARVRGDINAGGIAGSMAIEYDFDPEDDVTDKGSSTLNFKYKTKCVLSRCKNEGAVKSRESYAGGVVGRADLGSILFCEAYGSTESTDGDYVGGVVGKTESRVRGCVSKSTLSGGNYVGGIAGEGSEVTDSFAFPHFESYGENAGSVMGGGDRAKAKRNRFVGDALGAIDNINYTGIAEESTVEAFVKFVKSSFGSDVTFKLKFVSEGLEVSTVTFNYGDAIPRSRIPKVPEKEGCYGKWSYYNYDCATYDAQIEAEYYRDVEILLSGEKRDGKNSTVIIGGAFDDGASVTAIREETDAIDKYAVSIENVYAGSYTVRYLPQKSSSDIYVIKDGVEEKVETTSFAGYLQFKVEGENFEIEERVGSNLRIMILIVSLAAAVTIVVIITMATRRKKKKKENS